MIRLRPGERGEHVSWSRLALYACLLSLLLLVATLYPALAALLKGYSGHKVFRSIFETSALFTALGWSVVRYALVLLGLHLCVGALAAGLAYVTTLASPAINATRQSLMVLWFVALSVVILATAAAWYPRSHLGDHYHAAVTLRIGPMALYQWLVLMLTGAALLVCIRAAWYSRVRVMRTAVLVPALAAVSFVLAVLMWPRGGSAGSGRHDSDRPHVIVLGVDSLRTDVLARFGGAGPLHHLNAELAEAYLFRDAISPLARTFPAWVSILTGRHPRSTGALVNLVRRDSVRSYPTLADALQAAGYTTIFAMDEVRFANIDQSYGFDQIITPQIGAADFLLGTLNDTPLTNLLANTRLGGWLFPHTHGNRAAATRYFPETFIERLRREVRFNQPTLLVTHLTMPHWPYHDASPQVEGAGSRRSDIKFAEYLAGVAAADRQIAALFEFLRDQGVLDNAIVWFLSDHGEGLARPGDKLIRQTNVVSTGELIPVSSHGHGTSVLSPPQYQVLLAVRGYGRAATGIVGGESLVPASLEDLTPTTFDLLGIQPPGAPSFDGRSLLSLLTGQGDAAATLAGRIRYTETDFNLPRLLAGDINPGWLAMTAIDYYTVNRASGWVELKPERVPEIIALKERAAIAGDTILAALPALQGSLYVLASRSTGDFRILDRPPAQHEAVPARLWAALHERFAGELGAPQVLDKTSMVAGRVNAASTR